VYLPRPGVRKCLAVAAVGLMAALLIETPAYAATFNVRDYGATGNGSTNDTPAIQRAINAAADAGGANVVQFPPGTYRSANTIHLRSNITIQLDTGSTIMGAPNGTYDRAEPNPHDRYQDYGHSHFRNAMIWGDRLENIAFVGTGTIDGGGHLIRGDPEQGFADKIISLTRCNNLRVDNIRLRRGGHFAMLTNACNNITSNGLRIDGNRLGRDSTDRDGWNVINARNVTITNADIRADDDALGFKSDWALGQTYSNGNVRVTDSNLVAICCNALMFGSETCGDFTGYHFERITINGSNKSGLGMVSMDGTVISDVHYKDITMTNVRGAIMQKVGTRRRCGNNPGIGRIENVTYENIRSTGQSSANFSATLWGESGTNNRIRNISFTNVHLTVPGGNGCMGTGVPSNDPNNYNPVAIGTRPAYGWYLHRAHDIRFVNSSVQFTTPDCRPAVIANTGSNIQFDRFTAERSGNSPFDAGFQSVTGYCLRNSQNTSGGALRISATGSSQNCVVEPPPNRIEAESGTCAGTVDSEHAGFSGTGYCNTANAAGTSLAVTVNAARAGPTELRFGYANGGTANRPATLVVNGAAAGMVPFPATGGWTNWSSAVASVPLNAGANTVRLEATTDAGLPNADYVDIAAGS
jgi:polygalacturonase